MKAVLLSIKPKYCERIASGKKTIEVRKTRPKVETPFKCYIYCTQVSPYNKSIQCHYKASDGNYSSFISAKVIGEFICDRIEYLDMDSIGVGFMENGKFIYIDDLGWNTGLSLGEFINYTEGLRAYGWHIADLKIYAEPKELWELYKPGFEAMDDLDCDELCRYCHRTDYGSKAFGVTPNGYYSCEGAWCGEAYESYLEDNFALERPPQSWCYVEEL